MVRSLSSLVLSLSLHPPCVLPCTHSATQGDRWTASPPFVQRSTCASCIHPMPCMHGRKRKTRQGHERVSLKRTLLSILYQPILSVLLFSSIDLPLTMRCTTGMGILPSLTSPMRFSRLFLFVSESAASVCRPCPPVFPFPCSSFLPCRQIQIQKNTSSVTQLQLPPLLGSATASPSRLPVRCCSFIFPFPSRRPFLALRCVCHGFLGLMGTGASDPALSLTPPFRPVLCRPRDDNNYNKQGSMMICLFFFFVSLQILLFSHNKVRTQGHEP